MRWLKLRVQAQYSQEIVTLNEGINQLADEIKKEEQALQRKRNFKSKLEHDLEKLIKLRDKYAG